MMYAILLALFIIFNHLMKVTGGITIWKIPIIERYKYFWLLILVIAMITNIYRHYQKVTRNIDDETKIAEKNYWFYLQKEQNYYEYVLNLEKRKLELLQNIAPIILTFIFLQGFLDKLMDLSNLEFNEIISLMVILIFSFFYMETWHNYRFYTKMLYKYQDQLLQYKVEPKRYDYTL